MSLKFIAEVSSNHYRDLERCNRFIDEAAAIGCQAIKFQLFRIEELFAPEILAKSETHRSRKDWEFPVDFLPQLAKRCRQQNIQFSCTPFYLEAVEQLRPYVDFYKIASYELLWDNLLCACAGTGKPVILSTGMANMKEISHAVEVLKFSGCKNLTLLHCVSGYPTPVDECNLSAIETLRKEFDCSVGWSDHSVSAGVIQRAVHRWGAEVIEFHLDLDGKGAEYEAGHCWLGTEIELVISSVMTGSDADGDGIKKPVPVEEPDRDWRADPVDGLRPLQHMRKNYRG